MELTRIDRSIFGLDQTLNQIVKRRNRQINRQHRHSGLRCSLYFGDHRGKPCCGLPLHVSRFDDDDDGVLDDEDVAVTAFLTMKLFRRI